MRENDLTSLLVRPLEFFDWRKWNALVRAVAAITVTGSRNVRLGRCGDGVQVKFKGGKGIALPLTPLRVSLTTTAAGTPAITIGKGLIGGFEPQIEDVPVSALDNNGNPPSLPFDPGAAVDPVSGIGEVYADVTIASDYSILKVGPIVVAAPPAATAWHGYKLLAYLQRTPATDPQGTLAVLQAVYFNQGHTTSQRFGGKARHWFWAM